MTLEAALFDRLSDFAGLLIDGRQVPVYPVVIPQAVQNPAIRYQRVGAGRPHHMGGDDGLVSVRMQIDCYGADYNEARKVAEGVRLALQNWSGAGGIDVAYLENERDEDERETKSIRTMLEFEIWFRETVA